MENKKPLRILLADDHRVLRKGLSLLLSSEEDFVVVAEASDGEEALQKAREVPIDIALLDLSMPGMGGMECLRCLKAQQPDMRVLVLTMHSERQYVYECLKAGANGYLCKDTLDAELFRALRTVAAGGRYLSEREAGLLIDSALGECAEGAELSPREKEVLELIVHGYSLSTIADKLYLSIKTVSTYKTRLMQKLGCTQNSELVDYALRHNILGRKG